MRNCVPAPLVRRKTRIAGQMHEVTSATEARMASAARSLIDNPQMVTCNSRRNGHIVTAVPHRQKLAAVKLR